MNLPNKLTLLRVCLIPFFVILAKMEGFGMQLAAVGVYVLACVTDALDGRIARSRHLITNFGKFMDPIADKLLVMSAMIVLTAQGRMPDWVCILMLGREFLVSGFRLVAVENGVVIAAGPLGKLKTVFQMLSTIALMLLVPVKGAPLLGDAGAICARVLMYIALALTVVSGADYILRNRDCIRDM
jgi:CDP-diacylglycerol--glycerol-3-phosphate 3-phosphatidyltransferase